ncbi:hypothetical protein CcaverHIS002_0304050 [Cutaneotrichosporon cavernicola]|uniref:WD40 repeat-like protein n=1 Tax=Cutaneotrichosporon cavernicola TaxID=279322 RepID=A0AA48ICI1_9TREE|nr:uncharacterized protein CcaverHIS019_0304020 [Cutaneotrichosporon cavernicola]BEI82537.1 hypothetical protein CcaverHIS002_0304050 [Cutaneotrichosporon cavernicola]BEI90332.1 hypothetical protein CcaverHIS019_0304020 [Cutaneotrichosporon cavernicola]BEI98108.1 hypothetical protein CcaverHIS631_0304070 [Cutaneotrichosporon cavernicola]BEJ05885.1 hypothetical protein CcaverHIS641_0304070 [Cutaneotrichosporon cavernicola]
MADPFFQSTKKRKRPSNNARGSGPSRVPHASQEQVKAARDEELSSGDEGGLEAIDDIDFQKDRMPHTLDDADFVDANETAAEKRVRLARGYLDKVRAEVAAQRETGDYDAEEIDRELIAGRLRQEVDEAEGRIHRFYSAAESSGSRFQSTQHPPTGIAMTAAGPIYTSMKNGSVLRFDRETLAHSTLRAEGGGHKGAVLCIAASEDGKWVVTGGQDKIVGVWDMSSDEPRWAAGMRGHKDAVSSVVIPPLSNASAHVLSASLGRHLTLHSLSTLSALDTFFGHQDSITSVSALKPTTCVTAGSRDRTCRWWKVEEEVQLVLRSGGKTKADGREFFEGSVDVVCALDDSHFVSGGDSGTLALWSTGKKKPQFSHHLAHGLDTEGRNLFPSTVEPSPRWITALAAIRGTNLVVSGSWDGRIRFWAIDRNLRTFKPAGEIAVDGFINDIQILALPEGVVLVAAVGKEPRLGRWLTLDRAKNGVFVAKIDLTMAEEDEE